MTTTDPSAHAGGVTTAVVEELGVPGDEDRRWVYLWHWPIRAMHWIAAASIVALVITGFYIGRPYFMTGGENTARFAMGWMRFIHFAAASALVATGIVRVYWLFAGNRYERFGALFPVRKTDWVNLYRMIKYYLMIRPEEAPHYLGHHPLQQLTYTGTYIVTLVMVVTGFSLYGLSNPGGLFSTAFGWVAPLVGGNQMVRFIHHAATWFFLIFVPIHVYLALRADNMERTGTISSILSGGRFVPKDEEFIDG
jgi:Ni/Fe-hydrogenase 1 B-type cytochrome subunit